MQLLKRRAVPSAPRRHFCIAYSALILQLEINMVSTGGAKNCSLMIGSKADFLLIVAIDISVCYYLDLDV